MSLAQLRPLTRSVVATLALAAPAAAFADEPQLTAANAMQETPAPTAPDAATQDRLKQLEEQVRKLTEEIQRLKDAQKPEAVSKVVDEQLKKQKPTAGFDNGFYIQSADGVNRLRLRALINADFRAATSRSGRTNTDSFFMRRARPYIEGTIQKYVDFKLVPDFGGGATVLQDAYLQFNYLPSAQIRVGKFKEGMSLERLQSAADIPFIERSLANNLTPNRDVGIQVGGDIVGGRAYYSLGLFNGAQDTASLDGDAGNDKDFVARLFLTPFKKQEKHVLSGLGIGVGATVGSHDEAMGALNYRSASRASLYRLTAGTTGDGRMLRFAPQMHYYRGPFSFMGEYITSSQELINGATRGEIKNRGWFAEATYVVTGENAGFRGVVPRRPFDPKKGQWGALELAARYSRLDMDGLAFRKGFADPATSVGSAGAWTIGLNWYLSRMLKFQLNYERADFDRAIAFGPNFTDHEDTFLARFQIHF